MEWWDRLGELSHGNLLGDLGIDLRTIISQLVAVLIMLFLVSRIFFRPLRQALDDRTRYLEETYSDAENLKSEMQRLRDDYEQKLAAAEAESRERIHAAVSEAQALKDRIIAEARATAKEIEDRAHADMAQERQKMMLELRAHVVDLALRAAEKVTRETMSDERHRRLVSAFVEESGAA